MTDNFFICRRVRYGNNGNFVRYVPISLWTPNQFRMALLALVEHYRKNRSEIID